MPEQNRERSLPWLPAIGLWLLLAHHAAAADANRVEFFEKHIRPLLLNHCSKCHGPGKQEAGLRVDQATALFRGGESGPAIKLKQPQDSLLIARVTARGDEQMPPGSRLKDQQIAALTKWVEDGAVWPDAEPSASTRTDVDAADAVDPIEANDPALAEALELWLRADKLVQQDGQPVIVWPDSSRYGRDLSITAGVRVGGIGTAPKFVAKSMINGRPAVRFDRSNGLSGSPDHPLSIQGDAAFTIVLVGRFKRNPSMPYDSVLFIGNPAFPSDPKKPLSVLLEIEPKNRQLDLAGGWSHDASLGPGSAQVLFDQPNILTITRQRGPWTAGTRFRLNSEAGKKVWGREPSGTNEIPDIRLRDDIGVTLGRPTSQFTGFEGDIAELIVFNRVLTDRELAGLETTLSIRHGVTLPRMFAAAARRFTDDEKNYWAFRPVRRPDMPAVANREWPVSGIDHFILSRLERAGLQPSPNADRRTLIRRATFDLIGLPPVPPEVDAFLADPRDDRQALETVVNRLLESPHYGERWARHWLDVVRYAETTANDANAVMRYACRYRDYVIRSFNNDKAYDQFVVEQLAGDLLPDRTGAGRVDAVIATGFLMLGQKALAETDKEQSRLDVIDDQLDVTGRAFMGLTIGCARCHDHKFDPIPTVDYYSLAGIFRSTEVFRDEVRNASMWQEWSLEAEGAEPLMVMAPRETTPVSLRVHRRGDRHNLGIYTPRRFLQVIAGEDHAPLRNSNSGRLELARWIASPDNPLTARVMVNRIWQHHFGSGLVATSDNFGARGDTPSHPELLDWLAAEFVGSGWSIKTLHRKLLVSSTWMQSSRGPQRSEADPENRLLWTMPLRRLDAESIRDAILSVSGRLDTTPGVSDSGEFLYERGEVIDKNRDFFRPNRVSPDDPYYTEYQRRSVYLPVVRNAIPDVLALFDGADPNGVVARRIDTTVPSQSLFLLNHPFAIESSKAMAARLLKSGAATDQERVALAYRLALSRDPAAEEVESVLRFLREYSTAASDGSRSDELQTWAAFCQTLFCRNEFLYVN